MVNEMVQLRGKKSLIVWIGRFSSKTGYGTATRDYFLGVKKILKDKHVDLVGIDSSDGNIVGDVRNISFKKNGSKWVFTFPKYSEVYAICHEVAYYFRFIAPNGKVRFIGLTVHEFIEQIHQECDLLSLPQELWVPSLWNKNLICANLGFADECVKVLPHVYPLKHTQNSATGNTFKKFQEGPECKLTFLLIVSNVERKNASRVIAAFVSEFSSSEQVRLIVKLPGNLSQTDLEEKVLPPPVFLQKPLGPELILVRDTFTDAEMHFLLDISDVLINAETSKGFDLDSLLMLGKGKQVVATFVGGFTEYATIDNVYTIDFSESSFFNSNEYNNKEAYGNVVSEAPGISDICTALRSCANDLIHGSPKNNHENAQILRHKYSDNAIVEKILGFINQNNEDHDFLSLHTPELIIDKEKPYSKISFKYQSLTQTEIDALNNSLRHPHEFVSKDDWLDDRRKTFGSYGTIPPAKNELNKLSELKDMHQGNRCFIIGNGPSLNKTNLELLKNEFTFCANKFYLKVPELNWVPSFYTCLDWRVTPDDSENIQNFFTEYPAVFKFLPNRFKHLLIPDSNSYWYESISSGRFLREKFEIDATKCVRGGGTVATAMIQLAAFLGFKNIYLIGVDVTYIIPDTVKQDGKDRFNTGVKINLTSTADDDPNHFSPVYFGTGARWHDPNVPEMIRGFRASYLGAKLHGVNVFNATVGGALNCIPRVNYNELF